MVAESLKVSLNLLTAFYWLLEQLSLLIFGSMTSFFGIKVCVFLENDKTDRICSNFFHGLKNTCLLLPALKSTAPGL